MLFGSQVIIRAIVPDEPAFVQIQNARTEFITSKIIDKVRDEDDNEVLAGAKLIAVGDLQVINEGAPGM